MPEDPRLATAALKQALATAAILNLVMLGGALALLAVPVMAPVIADELGLSTALVGVYSTTLWSASIVTSISSGRIIARVGAFRASQAVVVLCALGAIAARVGTVPFFIIGALLIGLAHGIETPASSAILARVTAPAQQPVVFSLKQTGVQIGGIFAGALLPTAALVFGWRTSLLVLGLVLGLGAVSMRWTRHRLELAPTTIPILSFRAAFRVLVRDHRLLRLSAASFFFVGTQVCFNTFLVAYFVRDHGMSVAAAGGCLAASLVGGLVGRIVWGFVSGRLLRAVTLLALLGGAMVLTMLVLGFAVAHMSGWVIALACFLGGLTASGWNGVYLAEIARLAPSGQVAAITGASFLIGSSGLVLGPILYSLIASQTSFSLAYAFLGGFAALGIACLSRRAPNSPR